MDDRKLTEQESLDLIATMISMTTAAMPITYFRFSSV